MAVGLVGWGAAMERAFKEVLYRFLEEIHCTKAALYLLSGDGRYVLATQYGFGRRDLLAAEYPPIHTIVQKARELRSSPRAFNDPAQLPELASYLEGAGTARLLLVPLHGDSRVLGFIDARDKGRKLEFDAHDVELAGGIARAFLKLVQQYGLYTGFEEIIEPARLQPVPDDAADTQPPELQLDAAALASLARMARAAVAYPDVGACILTVVERSSAVATMFSRTPPGSDERVAVASHQRETLRQAGVATPEAAAWEIHVQITGAAEAGADALVVCSAVLLAASGWAVVASAVGAMGSSSVLDVLAGLRAATRDLSRLSSLNVARRLLARKLLQPGERSFPELEAHSLAVSRLAWSVGGALALGEDDLEELALAGLLHDVGMRELDYSNLYRHRGPGPEERRLYQRHVLVGEQILADAGLSNLAHVVRHHHERWDGSGYPDRLSGNAIPVASRIVHLAEVYDTLTAQHSYRAALPQPRALAMIRAAGGHQFDPAFVELLERVVE